MLVNEDIVMLRDSGISDEVIEARGYKSVKYHDCPLYLFSEWQCMNGLLIPLHGTDGTIKGHQLRPYKPRTNKKGKTVKYETPTGESNFLDINPLMLHRIQQPREVIWITEGAKKVDALATIGLPCIGLKGVWGWRGKNPQGGFTTVADWEDVNIKGNTFVIAFDNDIHTNQMVHDSMYRLKQFLLHRGADTVGILQLPYDPENKMGVDDYLASIR